MSQLPPNSNRSVFRTFILFLSLFTIYGLKAQNVGVNTTTPTAGMHVVSNDGLLIEGTYGSGSIQADSAGTRMMFSPKTGSFRVGRLTDENSSAYETWWNFVNTGDYSFVSGVNTRAKGYASFASGYKNQAMEEGSFVAGGKSNIASGYRSFATGSENTAFSLAEAVFGMNALEYTPASITSYIGTDRLFVVGNGVTNSLRNNALTILKNGNTGIGTAYPLARLQVDGNTIIDDSLRVTNFRMTNGASLNKVLTSDADGHGSWMDPNSLITSFWAPSGDDIYNTNLSYVGIGTNTPASKLHVAGIVTVDAGRIEMVNSGESIFIGLSAGSDDDLTNNRNVYIGYQSGEHSSTGSGNIGIGFETLLFAGSSSDNTAIGIRALSSSLSGNENTAIGSEVLRQNSSGQSNTAVGAYAMYSNTTGNNNSAFGKAALWSNVTGERNIAIGAGALYATTAGTENVAIGYNAGGTNTQSNNTFIGNEAGYSSTGSNNIFLGNEAGYNETGSNKLYIANSNTTEPLLLGDFGTKHLTVNDSLSSKYFQVTAGAVDGHVLVSDESGHAQWTDPSLLSSSYWSPSMGNIYRNSNVGINTNNPQAPLHIVGNTKIESGRLSFELTNESIFIGNLTGISNTGSNNIFMGESAGYANTSGSSNIAIGYTALSSNTTGGDNLSIGRYSMSSNISGLDNVALGSFSLNQNTASANIAIGAHALETATSGEENVSIGTFSGFLTQGDGNTFLGHQAGNSTTGDGNVMIGRNAGFNETGSNKLYIANTNTSEPLIYGDFSTKHLTIYDSLTTKEYRVNGGRINFLNTGQSIFIGDNAGESDDLSDNNSVFVGYNAGKQNIDGHDNIAIGTSSLDGSTTGDYNIAIGTDVLGDANLSGNLNVGIGSFSLAQNEGGHDNTALGQNTLSENTSGNYNVALGNFALDANTSGDYNTVLGYDALTGNIAGSNNVAVGRKALESATGNDNVAVGTDAGLTNTGNGNIFIGYQSGLLETGSNKLYIENSFSSTPLIYGEFDNNKVTINDSLATKYFQMTNGATSNYVLKSDITGRGSWAAPYTLFHNTTSNNLFIGNEVGQSVTTAIDNTIVGPYAGVDLTTGYENTGLGFWSLFNITTGTSNTAIGHNSLSTNVTGSNNTALGWSALAGTTGVSNTAVGSGAGGENTSGSRNVYMGHESGSNNQGSDNVFLGYRSGKNETGSNKLYIENSDSYSPLIYGDFSTNEVTINDSLTVNKELSIGTSVAKSTLEVNGSVAAKFKTPLVAGTTNPDDTGMVWRYNSGAGTITLPGASTCANRMYVIINQTGTTRTISSYRDLTTTPQTTLGSSVALWLMSDGSEWWQIK